jgi:hypothetical protein
MEEKKKSKKGLIIGLIIGATLLFIAAIVFLILFLFKPIYKITVNTNGKKLIKDIVVKDKTIKELPEIELNENEYLVAWVNEDGEAIRVGLPIEKGPISPVIGDPEKEKVTISFDTGTGEVLDSITINKGSGIILPVKPKNYEDWKFLYWVDKNEYLVIIGTPLYEDLTVYAYWWKPGAGGTSKETVKISFDTGTDEKLDDIEVPVGNKYIFRTPEKQNGDKVFKGWLDDKGNLLDENSIVEKAITLKAKWVEPYTCPEDCTPNEDGKTCNKKVYVDMDHSSECADPYEVIEGHCLDTANKFDPWSSGDYGLCPSNTYQWDICWGMGCERYCAKEVGFESGSWCREGYTEENGKCVKTETVECTAN